MSQLVRLEGKHSYQNAHCALVKRNVVFCLQGLLPLSHNSSASILLRRAYVTLLLRVSSTIFGDFVSSKEVCWNISSQGTSGSAPDLAGDFQRQSGSPAHNGQPDVWVNPMTDPTNAVSSDQAPSTSMLLNSPLQRDGQPLIIISGHGAHDEIQSRTFTKPFQMLHA